MMLDFYVLLFLGLIFSALLGWETPYMINKLLRRKANELIKNQDSFYNKLSEWCEENEGHLPSVKAKGLERILGKWLVQQENEFEKGFLRTVCFNRFVELKVPWACAGSAEKPYPTLSDNEFNDQFLYPLTCNKKVICAVIFAAIFGLSDCFFTAEIAFFWTLFAILTTMFIVIDLKIMLGPDEIMLAMFVLAIPYQLICFGLSAFIYAVITCIFFLIGLIICIIVEQKIAKVTPLGMGDIKFTAGMVLILGFPSAFWGVFAWSLSMIIHCLIMKNSFKQLVPAAPYMGIGLAVGLIIQVSSALL